MRPLCVAAAFAGFAGLAVSAPAVADVGVGGQVGAGAQGASTYSSVELRLDVAWTHARLGIGVRGVWDDDEFRASDWSSAGRAVTIVRAFEASGRVGETQLGVAAGALAPARVGRIVDGYRVSLDDRWRTGVRAIARGGGDGGRGDELDASLEIDDVLEPALVGGGVRWQMAKPWGMHLATAIDPGDERRGAASVGVVEVGAQRLFEGEGARAELGGSVTAEIMIGAGALAYGSGEIEKWGVTWSARGDVRAGSGAGGSLFGPLYRIERVAHDGRMGIVDEAKMRGLGGVGAGIAIGARAEAGWLELEARERPAIGPLFVVGAGAPMGARLQAAAWAAIARDDAAGAGEVRVAWAKRLFSALQAARIYRESDDAAVWTVTAWFGATTE
ncbi:MAG TPA: hypothetical protein VMZ53_09955 [Kofleriaceae bacterium]|nr:hypothetical protein [Kofleriaceae bacterium]